MNRLLAVLGAILMGMLMSCSPHEEKQLDYFKTTDQGIRTGGIEMIPVTTPKGTFNVWTKRIGNNPRMKLLLLHGGPGATHEYFESFESFLPQEGIEFIYYDQLGSTYSEQPNDTSLWDVDRFVDELEQVRTALGLTRNNFYLLGHSWGGWLAQSYALKYQSNIKGLIISNAMSSSAAYNRYATEVLAKRLDPAVLREIKSMEAQGDFGNPHYMELLEQHFYTQFICRLPLAEWPDPVTRSFDHINQTIYVMMQGPSEFGLSGKLEKYDVSSQLNTLAVPTLVIAAKYDTMDPEYLKWMSQQVQNGSYLLCQKGSHLSMYDDQQTYFPGLIKFIKAVDAGSKTISFP
jgi:proline iminopeptidase